MATHIFHTKGEKIDKPEGFNYTGVKKNEEKNINH